MRAAGQPAGRLTRERRRLAAAVLAPLPIAVACMLVIVGFADGWRLVLLTALAAAALAATRLRSSSRAALGLTMAVALLAIAGWGPAFDRRSPAGPIHPRQAHAHVHTHTQAEGQRAKG